MIRTLAFLVLSSVLVSAQEEALTPVKARQLSEELYIYGYPAVILHMHAQAGMNRRNRGFNQLLFRRERASPGTSRIVRANPVTVNGGAFLDLSHEPVVLHVPDTDGRYYVAQLMDGWTDTFASIGARTTGTEAGNFAITGPGWTGKLPKGLKQVNAPTDFVWVIIRIHLRGESDRPNVIAIQNGFSLKPLSAVGREYTPTPFVRDPAVDISTRPPVQIEQMDAVKFFQVLSEAMKLIQPRAEERDILRKLARLGIEPGKPFQGKELSAETRAALKAGKKAASEKILSSAPQFREPLGGNWTTGQWGVYGTDYLKRALVARGGLGANPPEDATYGSTRLDGDGNPLNGSHSYVIHFRKDALPPVNAFWAITVYDAEGYLVENPIRRYALGDQDSLHYASDGSLDIHLQNENPEGRESNWLPVPRGPFSLNLRLYWPKEEILTRKWKAPPVQRVR